MMIIQILLLLKLLLVVIVNSTNDLILVQDSNDRSYSLQKGDSIDEFVINEHLEYLGLPSLYWFDSNEIIEYDKLIEVGDDSRTMVTGLNMIKSYQPLLAEPSSLLSTSSSPKGYITILKQLRSNAMNSTCLRNGTFCVDQLIFKGGHGDVYKANKVGKDGKIEFNSTFILKRMIVKDRPAIERCAIREIYFGEKLKRIQRIARYERYFRDDEGNYWLVFRDEGVSLQSLLYSIYVSNQQAIYEPSQFWRRLRKENDNKMMMSIMKQIIMGVAQLHERGIVHRDIKPSNVLLNIDNAKPKLVIADFSSAISSDLSGTLNYELYGAAGASIDEETLNYAPPETLLSLSPGKEIPFDNDNPESFDSWSVGILFLEMILGTGDVFSVDQRTAALINQRIRNDDKAIADALLLAALADYCILPNDVKSHVNDVTIYGDDSDDKTRKRRSKFVPFSKNANGFYVQGGKSCSTEDFQLAILRRDPLGIGFKNFWGVDLLTKLLAFRPSSRITLSAALQHAYFTGPYLSEIDGSEHATDDLRRLHEFNIAETDNTTGTDNTTSTSNSTFSFAKDVTSDLIFTCSECGRKFKGDYNSCLRHVKGKKHGLRCHFDQNLLQPCLSEKFLILDDHNGWCDLQGRRSYIEDKHVIVYQDDHKHFLVADGHFGIDCSNYVGHNLYSQIFEQIEICQKQTTSSLVWNDIIQRMAINLDINNDKIEWNETLLITKNMNDILMANITASSLFCAVAKSFYQVNQNFLTSKFDGTSGTTATIAMLFDNHLLIAHVGDSRVVLCCNSQGQPIQATLDHTPYSPQEKKRVYESGGFVEENGGVLRVNGRLAITRSMGDRDMREYLSDDPDILLLNLHESATTKSIFNSSNNNNNCMKYASIVGQNLMFLILASDGLWDSVTNSDATEIVCEYLLKEQSDKENWNSDNMHNAAKILALEAFLRQSMDNIGVCIQMILK